MRKLGVALLLFFLFLCSFMPMTLAQDLNSLSLGEYYRNLGWDKLKQDDMDSALYFNRQALANGPVDNNWTLKMKAERQYFQAHASEFKQEYADAIAHVERAQEMCKSMGAWGDTLEAFTNILKGHIHTVAGNTDQAEPVFEKANQQLEALQLGESTDAASLFVNWGLMYQYQGNIQKAQELYEKSVEVYKMAEEDVSLELSKVYLDLGTINFIKNNIAGAVENFEDGLHYLEETPAKSSGQQAKLYYNLAAATIKLKDFETAARHAAAAREIWTQLGDPRKDKVSALMGIIYGETGQWDKAIEHSEYYYRKAVGLYGPNSRVVCGILGNLGQFYLSKGDLENARLYTEKAWQAVRNMPNPPILESFTLSKVDAIIAAHSGNDLACQEALEKCYRLGKKMNKDPNALMIDTHAKLSNIYYEQKKFDKALSFGKWVREARGEKGGTSGYYIIRALMAQEKFGEAEADIQKAYDVLGVDLDLEVPTLIPREEKLRPSIVLVQNLTLTGQFYRFKARKNGSEKDWLHSYQAYRLAADYLDSLRLKNKSFDTQTDLLEEKHRVFEQGMDALYQLYLLNGEEKWIEQAFLFSEKSKAILLSESLNANRALTFAGIPQDLQEREQGLKKKIYYLQRQVSLAKKQPDPAVQAKVEGWNQEIFELSQEYEKLAERLRRDYPDYMELRYQPEILNVDEVRDALRDGEALLEYFVGDSSAYAILLKQKDLKFIALASPTQWASEVSRLRRQVFQGARNTAASSSSFAGTAFALYRDIWEPLEAFDLPQKVLIVPDGPLGYLSFDILMTRPPGENGFPRSSDYLIQDHQLRYTYSGKMLIYEGGSSYFPGSGGFIAFAPTYPTGDANIASLRGDLADLPFAYQEAQQAKKLMGGSLMLGKEASEDNFKAMAADFSVIHIAAHARVNDENPLYSSIYFTPGAGGREDQALEVFELFNMKLSADLVVLSACETGVGEVKRGEGMISLAWGAAYAGARSVLTSLWQVNDQATSSIIQNFYSHLKKGKDKDEALRIAKLDYIANGDALSAHTFYSGGLIMVGDHHPLRQQNWILPLATLALIFLAMGIGWSLYRRRKTG